MVSYLPNLSLAFILAALVPLIIGFVVGLIIRNFLKIGIAIAVLIVILILLGILTPNEVLKPILSLFESGGTLTNEVKRLAAYLPWSSLTFLIGLAIGFLKG